MYIFNDIIKGQVSHISIKCFKKMSLVGTNYLNEKLRFLKQILLTKKIIFQYYLQHLIN